MKTSLGKIFFMMPAAIAMLAMPFAVAAPVFAASRSLPPSAPQAHAPAAESPSDSGNSYNWSGYETTGGAFTGVGATWIIPTVPATNSLTADATWVGIGGVTAHDLIQVGTQAVTGNGADQVQYQAWFETLPASTRQIPLTVNAGDSVTASVTQVSVGEWQISFRDNTTGSQYSAQVAYASSLSSAEWIEEAPSDQDGIMPLDQFGAVSFSGAYVIQNGSQVTIAGSGAMPLSMANGANQIISVPSALNSGGASFTISRTSAAATVANAPGIGYVRGRGHRVGVGIQGFSPGRGGNGGNNNFNPALSGSASTGTSPSSHFNNFGGGQFRFQFGFGSLSGHQQLFKFFREQFNRGF
jgi:hypothetical protein